MTSSPKSFSMIEMFHALGDRTRLRILNLIGNQEVCVCYFVEALRIDQPKVSRHLAYLRRAHLVRARKDGRWVHYRLRLPSQPAAARMLREVLAWASTQRECQRDQERFAAACCQPDRFVSIQRAPAPATVASAAEPPQSAG